MGKQIPKNSESFNLFLKIKKVSFASFKKPEVQRSGNVEPLAKEHVKANITL